MPRAKTETPKPDVSSADTKAAAARSYLSQTDVPGYSLAQALRVPQAIADSYAYKPTRPLQVAQAMGMQPNSGGFRGLTGAAIAYGLTTGGAKSDEIAITDLGLRIVRPLKDGDDVAARREALLKPRVVGDFLRHFDNAPLPPDHIARNILVDMKVPADRAQEVHALIIEGAEHEGLLRGIKNRKYVDLSGAVVAPRVDDGDTTGEDFAGDDDASLDQQEDELQQAGPAATLPPAQPDRAISRRVFITHGKNKAFVDPIRKLLGFGEMEAVVAVDRTSVAQPVPDKVMGEMRACGAAIIHVDAESRLLDKQAAEVVVLNPNVLIEIGAAMALYGRRFILLVREGIELPSNLQGLFEVRYSGDTLDGDATIRLLEAINDIKNHAVPSRYTDDDAASA